MTFGASRMVLRQRSYHRAMLFLLEVRCACAMERFMHSTPHACLDHARVVEDDQVTCAEQRREVGKAQVGAAHSLDVQQPAVRVLRGGRLGDRVGGARSRSLVACSSLVAAAYDVRASACCAGPLRQRGPTLNVMPHKARLVRGAIAYGPARKWIVSTLPPRHGELGWWAFSGGSNIG